MGAWMPCLAMECTEPKLQLPPGLSHAERALGPVKDSWGLGMPRRQAHVALRSTATSGGRVAVAAAGDSFGLRALAPIASSALAARDCSQTGTCCHGC